MRVSFICGYYPDLAHNTIARRPEPYWDAYFFTWAVKVGSFRRPFFLRRDDGNVRIQKDNFPLVRQSFGQFVANEVDDNYSGQDALLVPVPSKDRLRGVKAARSTNMLIEAMADTAYAAAVSDKVRWKGKLAKAHEGGPRGRDELRNHLEADPALVGRNVILVDDLLSTGGAMLACKDVVEGAGANVIGAVTCGKTIYTFDIPPFSRQEFELTGELADFAR